MRPFAFVAPTTIEDAVHLLAAGQGRARVLAGGSDLLGELKDDVVHYEQLISLGSIASLRHIRQDGGSLRLGALVTLVQLEYDPRVLAASGMLAEAARGVATPEIRHQGTLGGNLCQRPRCLYYRQALTPCLKKGGTDCPAFTSPYQGYLSIMGGHGCYSVHASDLAPPLIALEAQVTLQGSSGARSMLLEQFVVGPEQQVRRENVLADDEILTEVEVPASPAGWQGAYLKARERTAGDFPLVSVAAGYSLIDGRMRHARLVLGGVAPMPWRCRDAEAVLEGAVPSQELARQVTDMVLAPARPLAHNAFKLDIARALVPRAILAVAAPHRAG